MAFEQQLTPEQSALIGQTGYESPEGPTDGMQATVTEGDDGSSTFEFAPDGDDVDEALAESEHNSNLTEVIEEDTLDEIGSAVLELVDGDEEDRADWLEILKDSIRLLGLKNEVLSEPFNGACSATHPILIESVTKFQAKAFSELFPSLGPVQTKILGTKTEPREQQAQRVKEFMNYEVTELMPEFGPELDRLLFYCGLTGSAFKKTFFDPTLDRPVSQFVTAEDFIVPYHATNLQSCERYAHKIALTSNKLLGYQLSGFYRDVELGPGHEDTPNQVQTEIDKVEGKTPGSNTEDIHTFYEVHINYDLPGFEHTDAEDEVTGLGLPYIITVDRDTHKVLSIRRNWKEGDPLYAKQLHFTHYKFVPGLGFYGYGYLHLVGSLSSTATSTLRQLVDAGTFANLPAGFKAHGMRVVGDDSPIQPGEFRDVQLPGADLQRSIMPLPFKEPSATLFNLLNFIVEASEKFADSTESIVSEAKSYGPQGTIMALLEQGGKLFSAIHKRLHAAQGQDFKILARLNAEWMPEKYPYEIHNGANVALKTDFDGRIDVIPVSDPNMPTQSHRIAKANAIFSVAIQAPQEHNLREVLTDLYMTIGVEEPERFLKELPQEAQPADPVTENTNALQGKPIKSGLMQNHGAHLKAHHSFSQLPAVMQNPQAGSALLAHIQEHVAQDYLVRVQQKMGQEMPQMQPGQQMPPEMENKIAIAAAQATEEMVKDDASKQIAEDPTIMVALEGLKIEKEKVDNDRIIKMAKQALDEKQANTDAADKDLDRASRIKIASIQQEGRDNATGK